MSQIPAHKRQRVIRKGGSVVINPKRKSKDKQKAKSEVKGNADKE